MIDFNFCSPTKIFFGKNKENEIGAILNSYGFKKVLIIIGKAYVKKSGLLDKITDILDKDSIECCLFEGVRANPQIDECRMCMNKAREFNPDVLLAIGGGSVIDTAKNVAAGYYYDGDQFDFNSHLAEPTKALPIGVVLTISAAGSELSNSCVIQDDILNLKSGFNSDIVRPLFVIENPELTYSLPKNQVGYGIVDILMHTLERYFVESSEFEPADNFSLALLKSVVDVARKVYNNPTDYESHAVLMLMSSLSHNDLTNIGKKKAMPVHQLEHALSGLYPFVAHGAGLAVLFPVWARYYVDLETDKFDFLAKIVFNKSLSNKRDNAIEAINELERLFSDLEMPKTFKDLGITNPDIEKLADLATKNNTKKVYHRIKPLDKDAVIELFKRCI